MEVGRYDYLIVGAGLSGATFAYLLREVGKRCLVIDRRPHRGGNLYCEDVEGIRVHKYGAHIFHTSDKEVWDFVNRFVSFNNFINAPLAKAPDGKVYNLPFNMNTFNRMWGCVTPAEAREIIEGQRTGIRRSLEANGISYPRNLEEQALLLAGEDIYRQLIKGYTEKQWGRRCSELPAFIISRLPLRFTYDNNYFNDRYQGVPEGGYNLLIDGLLEGTEVMTDADYFSDRSYWDSMADRIIFTGPIDRFFDYRCGELHYRSLRFESEILPVSDFQGNAVVNYTSSEVPFTRIIEHKHFEMSGDEVGELPHTVISREYPMEATCGSEPFYPVNDSRNNRILEAYRLLASERRNVIFAGRLGEYRYYDMDKVIRSVLTLFSRHYGETGLRI